MKKTTTGFTIVELIIVIVVIAILAAISIVAYTGIQERAQRSKVDSDIRTIITAIEGARHATSSDLRIITGSGYTAGTCVSKPAGTDLAALPSSDTCISRYITTLNAISAASGIHLGDMRDPWGRPYRLDENEGESGGCSKDSLSVYAIPFTGGLHSWTPGSNVPRGGFSGCPTP